jgi:hypothetical protein
MTHFHEPPPIYLISAIYEQVCGGSTANKKIDSKVWTNYFGELYKYSNSTEYLSLEYTFGICGCSSEAFIWLDLLSKIKCDTKSKILLNTTKSSDSAFLCKQVST